MCRLWRALLASTLTSVGSMVLVVFSSVWHSTSTVGWVDREKRRAYERTFAYGASVVFVLDVVVVVRKDVVRPSRLRPSVIVSQDVAFEIWTQRAGSHWRANTLGEIMVARFLCASVFANTRRTTWVPRLSRRCGQRTNKK